MHKDVVHYRKIGENMSKVNFFIQGAIQSKYNAAHWFRYLRKMIANDKITLTSEEISELLNNDNLTMFQKVVLKRATVINSPTFLYIASLNKPAKLKFCNALRKRLKESQDKKG